MSFISFIFVSNTPAGTPSQDPNNPFFEAEKREKKESKAPSKPSSGNPFSGIISQCFEPYLSIYIESQGRERVESKNSPL